MNPEIWGSNIWYLLHIIVQHPNSPNYKYKQFFYTLQYLLPCPKCRNNYIKHILNETISSDNNKLSKWLFNIHNNVNKDIGKPILTYNEVYQFWENEFIKLNNIENTKIFTIIEYFLYEHPGFYKVDIDYINNTILFWDILPQLLPKKLNGLIKFKQYIKNNKLNIDIISHKIQYQEWFNKMKKYLNIKNNTKNINFDKCIN